MSSEKIICFFVGHDDPVMDMLGELGQTKLYKIWEEKRRDCRRCKRDIHIMGGRLPSTFTRDMLGSNFVAALDVRFVDYYGWTANYVINKDSKPAFLKFSNNFTSFHDTREAAEKALLDEIRAFENGEVKAE